MSQMRKLLESMDAISEIQSGDINNVDPEKEKAFADLGLDEHQWDVFELVWDYCKSHESIEHNWPTDGQ